MKYHVYILYSPKFDKYYIGQSANLEARIIAHNIQDKASFTSKYRPWLLCVTLQVNTRSIAMRVEKYLKKKNREFLQRVISEPDLRKYIIETHSSAG